MRAISEVPRGAEYLHTMTPSFLEYVHCHPGLKHVPCCSHNSDFFQCFQILMVYPNSQQDLYFLYSTQTLEVRKWKQELDVPFSSPNLTKEHWLYLLVSLLEFLLEFIFIHNNNWQTSHSRKPCEKSIHIHKTILKK